MDSIGRRSEGKPRSESHLWQMRTFLCTINDNKIMHESSTREAARKRRVWNSIDILQKANENISYTGLSEKRTVKLLDLPLLSERQYPESRIRYRLGQGIPIKYVML